MTRPKRDSGNQNLEILIHSDWVIFVSEFSGRGTRPPDDPAAECQEADRQEVQPSTETSATSLRMLPDAPS